MNESCPRCGHPSCSWCMNDEARDVATLALELVRGYGRIRRLTDQRYNEARERGPIEEPLGFYREEDEALARIRELADELAGDR